MEDAEEIDHEVIELGETLEHLLGDGLRGAEHDLSASVRARGKMLRSARR
jgi:hypothetical protein